MKLFIFFCDLLMPLSMTVGGLLMLRRPPKKVNGFYGYRTPRSAKSPEAWAFAQAYCGKLWFCAGLVLLPASALAHLPFIHSGFGVFGWVSIILITLQGIIMVGSMWPVERALKRKFDNK